MENPATGVFQSACQLFDQLKQNGVKPRVVGPVAFPEPFSREQVFSGRFYIPARLAGLKPVWPILSSRALARRRWQQKPAVLHGLSNINLPVVGAKPRHWRWVVTVHDTIPLIKGTGLNTKLVTQYRWLLPRVLARADAIITVSHWTKRCLIEAYPEASSRIHVIPNGFVHLRSDEIRSQPASEVIRTLTISRGEPYKRLDRLITLYRMYRERLSCTLVTDQRGLKLIGALAPELIDSGSFRIYTDVSPAMLACLYANTDVYLHPSLYEGFCLPAAEAISHGKPVVYQRGSGIDEVAGEIVGVALEPAAPEDEWLHSIETAFRRSQATNWPLSIQTEIARQPSWKQSAEALKLLYANLLQA